MKESIISYSFNCRHKKYKESSNMSRRGRESNQRKKVNKEVK